MQKALGICLTVRPVLICGIGIQKRDEHQESHDVRAALLPVYLDRTSKKAGAAGGDVMTGGCMCVAKGVPPGWVVRVQCCLMAAARASAGLRA
ncbi:hypothetical protein [uncultured Stenotrophomonas sp.]|uniref:hypothetical protein n=1 Tax=uncultured Stenotrophomonas sp. TaxID=165438 RepID=UPI0025FAE884|nr:hypothetical protein [uncultured Stenotrophomonas sp.]